MFQLMRNIHLGLGLVFVLMALIFAVSSLVIVYRPYLETSPTETELEVQLSAEAARSPRAAARELMRTYDLAGDLRQIREDGETVRFRIFRPGKNAQVEYAPASGEAKVKIVRPGALETLVQLHLNHGFWHDYMPANLWAALSFLASLGLLLLGATGLYLWFALYKERLIGGILLGVGLIYGLVTLTLTRMQQ